MKRVCLLTGKPGSGKTSLIKRVVSELKLKAGGFYTEEIRIGGVRQGFRLVTLDGESAILAHIDIKSSHRVSKYGVDTGSLARVGVPALYRAARDGDLVVVDEIGKMELFSPEFRKAILQIIDSGKKVLGTIMLAPDPWADAIKKMPQVEILTVTRTNNHQVLAKLRDWLGKTEDC